MKISPSIPPHLQALLWSVDIKNLDMEKDKSYIIHQIFAYGKLEDIIWVFRVYPKKEIIKTFTTIPFKDYSASRFLFIKKFVLGLKNDTMNELRYVKNTPRDIRYQ